MKAVVLREHGGPDVLRVEEVSTPSPAKDQVLVKVRATGVNRIDVWIRSGLYKLELPRIIGVDVAGEVYDTGPLATKFSKGERVIIMPALVDRTCSYCEIGWESLCDNFRLLGMHADGGYAEFVTVPEGNIYKIPHGVKFEEAACIPVNFITAWHMLVTRAGVEAGMTVLVLAGSSGIGSAAIQICKLWGATVITTVGDDWKVKKAEELGADYVINRKKQDYLKEVMEITGKKGVDIVFEHVGSATWDSSLKTLKKGGTLVIAGATTGSEAKIDIRYLYRRQLNVLGSYLGNFSEFRKILELFAKKKLKAVIDSEYSMSKVSEAHKRMESNAHFGKMIIKP